MKHKFSSMGRVAIALVLALSLCLVMTVPVAALTEPTVAVAPVDIEINAAYTIGFDVTTGLALNTGSITVKFPVDTDVPTSYVDADITVETAGGGATSVPALNISVTGQEVTITTPVAISGGDSVEVIFTLNADIINPTTGGSDYTLEVKTSQEPIFVTSAVYTIGVLPVVDGVSPGKGNDGDIMWVEVAGSGFVEDGTTFDFGSGVSVVSYHFVDATEIDCEITITAAGDERYVIPTTWGAGTNTSALFDPNPENTAQVDVWLKYTPDDDPFDSQTLVFDDDVGNPFATITLGIAAAADGTDPDRQVLIVHAATYTETDTVEGLVVDQDYVTIKSLSGAATTFLEQSGADHGVTLKGIGQTIEDLTIYRGGSVGGLTGVKLSQIGIDQVGDDFTIKGCTFSDWDSSIYNAVIGGNDYGRFTNSTITSGLIEGNTFTGNSRTAIWLETAGGTVDGIVIKDNHMLGCLETDGHGKGIMLVGDIGDTVAASIDGNTISNMNGDGIQFYIESVTGDTGKATITDNTISGCADGIDALAGWDLTITENTLENNSGNGIKIRDGSQGTVVIEYNDITGNTEYGLKNEDDGDTIVARYNWWNAIGGPSDGTGDYASTALGNGDAVSKLVTYNPWLIVSYETVVEDGVRFYGSDTLTLQVGWNTLSVPLKLYDAANTIAEIEGMGDFLTAENYSDLIYEYDPVEGWVEPTTVLTPCHGYYIKMKAASSFPVLYSNSLGLPALELAAGWNLIGSAFGIDKLTEATWAVAVPETDTDEAQMGIGAALDSIRDQVSVVVSPSAPGQIGDPWSVVWSSGNTTDLMYTGEGYWVFMTDTGTLAGFEITPFYFTP